MAGSEMERALPVEENFLEDWPQRPWVLAGLGLLAGLAVNLILEADGESAFGSAAAAFCFFAFIAATFVLRPSRFKESAIFVGGLGLVMGGIAFFAADWSDTRAGTEFAFAAGVFFSLLAIPLFQADCHRKRWQTDYAETHFHVWTDAVSAGGAFAFVGLSWLVLWLLQALFSIVGIEFIEALIDTVGFPGAFMGAAFGGAMGVLRNQLGVLGTLQRVVMLVFALLAVPFAFALVIFLFVLLTSGGSALWEATDSATPVLLTCAVFAFIFANAIIRDDDEARSSNVVMQAAALVLAFCILPLAIFAAISTGIRIDQYGLSPERIWALIAVVITTAYGIAYWAGLIRGRLAAWGDYLRRANLYLAAVTCVLALILSLPILDFGAISTRDQLARLQSGAVSAEEFDFTALRWDFGMAGREALNELAEGEGDIADLAQAALQQDSRPYYRTESEGALLAADDLRVISDDPQFRAIALRKIRSEPWRCDMTCAAVDLGEESTGIRRFALIEGRNYDILRASTENLGGDDPALEAVAAETARPELPPEVSADSVIEVRQVTRDHLFVDGVPFQMPLTQAEELPGSAEEGTQ